MPTPRDSRWSRSLRVWLTSVFIVGLCQLLALVQETVFLVGSGSNVPAPLYNKWAEEYNKRTPRIQLRYLSIGTSEGIEEISRASGDFGAGEVPLTTAERARGKLIEVPSLLIAIVPIYNLPKVHEELRFSGELLAEIFLGHVKNWSASQIAQLNANATLPDLPIKVVYRPAGKGSNYVFTDFLSKSRIEPKAPLGTSEPVHVLSSSRKLPRFPKQFFGLRNHAGLRPGLRAPLRSGNPSAWSFAGDFSFGVERVPQPVRSDPHRVVR
jgi:ABC-type phosphate transport system substrate-binding protein